MDKLKTLVIGLGWFLFLVFAGLGMWVVSGQEARVDLRLSHQILLNGVWIDIPQDEVIRSDKIRLKLSIQNLGELSTSDIRLFYEIPCYSGYPLVLSESNLLNWENMSDHYENQSSSISSGEILEREIQLNFVNSDPVEQYCISHIRVVQNGVEGEYYEDYSLLNVAYDSESEINSGCLWSVCDLL